MSLAFAKNITKCTSPAFNAGIYEDSVRGLHDYVSNFRQKLMCCDDVYISEGTKLGEFSAIPPIGTESNMTRTYWGGKSHC
jgi:hypothetical protein